MSDDQKSIYQDGAHEEDGIPAVGDRVIYRDTLGRNYPGEILGIEGPGVYTLGLDNGDIVGACASEIEVSA